MLVNSPLQNNEQQPVYCGCLYPEYLRVSCFHTIDAKQPNARVYRSRKQVHAVDHAYNNGDIRMGGRAEDFPRHWFVRSPALA